MFQGDHVADSFHLFSFRSELALNVWACVVFLLRVLTGDYGVYANIMIENERSMKEAFRML